MALAEDRAFSIRLGEATAVLRLGDALERLKEIRADSIDLVVTSPPYCIGKAYEKTEDVRDFEREHARVLAEIIRVTKPGGSICWQVGYHVRNNIAVPLDALIYQASRDHEQLHLRNRIIWTFGHGTHSKRRFSGRHETIMWFTKGDQYFFDLDAVRIKQKYPGKRHYKGPKKGEFSGNPLGKNPEDVWLIPNVKAKHVEKLDHPCQFPVALISRLVRSLCPATGVVLDPYFGSGTSAVAALMNNRNFLGSEIETNYFDIACGRLETLANDELRVRNDLPVREPDKRESVAKPPAHFWRDNADG